MQYDADLVPGYLVQASPHSLGFGSGQPLIELCLCALGAAAIGSRAQVLFMLVEIVVDPLVVSWRERTEGELNARYRATSFERDFTLENSWRFAHPHVSPMNRTKMAILGAGFVSVLRVELYQRLGAETEIVTISASNLPRTRNS